MSNLRSANLNLLPILRELLRKRNVTYAAEELHMSQPAVSEALGRLRQLFHDEILIQEGRTLIPTALAERLLPMLESSLGEIETLLSRAAFNPAEASGTIQIATADYVVLVFGAELSARLSQQAPGLKVRFLAPGPEIATDLRVGRLDFFIVPTGVSAMPLDEFDHQMLFEDEIVCIVADSAPVSDPISQEELLRRRHVIYGAAGDVSLSFGGSVLQQSRIEHFDAVCVTNFLLLPFLVETTQDSIALVQRRLAERLAAAARIRIVRPPFEFPKLRVVLVWNRGKTHDQVHTWFRTLMRDITRSLQRGDAPASGDR